MVAFTDGRGNPLSGGSNYLMNLPANIPADSFWSVTLYEAENGSGLANGQPFPSLGSRDKPTQNSDGSTDLYLGPTALKGNENNWLATAPAEDISPSLDSTAQRKRQLTRTGSLENQQDKLKKTACFGSHGKNEMGRAPIGNYAE